MAKRQRQSGAVSIFSVVFAAMLLTILTIGFLKLMIRDQQQATNNDLSQSAYDAALAGVEDAKRVIRAAQQGAPDAQRAMQQPNDCRVIKRAKIIPYAGDDETMIRSGNTGGLQFNQAYTCVNINLDSPDFLYEAKQEASQLVPLRAVGTFNKVVLQWYTQQDNGDAATASIPPEIARSERLPANTAWGETTPPLMRAQLITPGAQFDTATLDRTGSSRTVFLRPYEVVGGGSTTTLDVSSRARATDVGGTYDNTASTINCSRNFANDSYACSVELTIPAVTVDASRNAFVRLNTLYKGAHVRVILKHGDSVVNFNGVQPIVDATGRANNLFRRVEARLQIGDDFPYPDNALHLKNSLCKDFSVTDEKVMAGSCEPASHR